MLTHVVTTDIKIKLSKPSPNDTQTISPRRVFECNFDHRILWRREVWKDDEGRYHCPFCSAVVVEITNTVTGNDFMEITR